MLREQHLLPNFNECWWDRWLLDVLICNNIGIVAGEAPGLPRSALSPAASLAAAAPAVRTLIFRGATQACTPCATSEPKSSTGLA